MGEGRPLTREEKEYIESHREQAAFDGSITRASRGYKPSDSDPKSKVKKRVVFQSTARVGGKSKIRYSADDPEE